MEALALGRCQKCGELLVAERACRVVIRTVRVPSPTSPATDAGEEARHYRGRRMLAFLPRVTELTASVVLRTEAIYSGSGTERLHRLSSDLWMRVEGDMDQASSPLGFSSSSHRRLLG
jgi:hypothetical protein